MTRNKFKICLIQALGYKDQIVSDNVLEMLLDLNWNSDSSLVDWDYADFTEFADDIASNGFWDAVKNLDLNIPE